MASVIIQLTPETEQQLRLQASRCGETLEAYLGRLAEREAGSRPGAPDMLGKALEWLTHRGAEEVQSARERVLGAARPPRELSPSQGLIKVLEAKWPGSETDAEVREALDRIS